MRHSDDSQAPRTFRMRSDGQGVLVQYSHALFGDSVLILCGLGMGVLFTCGAWVSRADGAEAGMLLLIAAIGFALGILRILRTLQVDTYRVEPRALTLHRSPFTSLRRSVLLEPAQVRDVTLRKLEFMGRQGRTTVWFVEAALREGSTVALGRFVDEAEAQWLAGTLRKALRQQ